MSPSAKPTPVQKYNYERSCYRWLVTRHPAQFERMEFTAKILESASKARKAFYGSDWAEAKVLIRAVDGKYERTPFFDRIIKRGLCVSTRFDASVLKSEEVAALGMCSDQSQGYRLEIRQFRAQDDWVAKSKGSRGGEADGDGRQRQCWPVPTTACANPSNVTSGMENNSSATSSPSVRTSTPTQGNGQSLSWERPWDGSRAGKSPAVFNARGAAIEPSKGSSSPSCGKVSLPGWSYSFFRYPAGNCGSMSPGDTRGGGWAGQVTAPQVSCKRWRVTEPTHPGESLVQAGAKAFEAVSGHNSGVAGPVAAGNGPVDAANYYGATPSTSRPLLQGPPNIDMACPSTPAPPPCDGSLLAHGYLRLAQQSRKQQDEVREGRWEQALHAPVVVPSHMPPVPPLALRAMSPPGSPQSSEAESKGDEKDAPSNGGTKRKRESVSDSDSDGGKYPGPVDLLASSSINRSKRPMKADDTLTHPKKRLSRHDHGLAMRCRQLGKELVESNRLLQAARNKYELAKQEWDTAKVAHQAKRDELTAAAEKQGNEQEEDSDQDPSEEDAPGLEPSVSQQASCQGSIDASGQPWGDVRPQHQRQRQPVATAVEQDELGSLERDATSLLRGMGMAKPTMDMRKPAVAHGPTPPSRSPSPVYDSPAIALAPGPRLAVALPRLPSCPPCPAGSPAAAVSHADAPVLDQEAKLPREVVVLPTLNPQPPQSQPQAPEVVTSMGDGSGGNGGGVVGPGGSSGGQSCSGAMKKMRGLGGLGRLIGLMSEGPDRADIIKC
ncbi:unnamed protein product [Discosporangium mesarthrocarpum]